MQETTRKYHDRLVAAPGVVLGNICLNLNRVFSIVSHNRIDLSPCIFILLQLSITIRPTHQLITQSHSHHVLVRCSLTIHAYTLPGNKS